MRSRRLPTHEFVSEVRGGVGTMAAVELKAEALRTATPRRCRAGAGRACGRDLRTSRGNRDRGVAAADRATAEHFAMIAEGIEYGLSTLREDVLLAA